MPSERLRIAAGQLMVSPICLGIVQDRSVVGAAFDAGINFFFISADMHWLLYEQLRLGLADLLRSPSVRREDIVVAGVSYACRPEFSWDPFHEIVRAVPALSYVDVTIAGGLDATDMERRLSYFRTRHLAKDSELPHVRATGGSFHSRAAAKEAAECRWLDVALLRYNAQRALTNVELFEEKTTEVEDVRAPLFAFKAQSSYVSRERAAEIGLTPNHWLPTRGDHYRFALTPEVLSGLLVSLDSPRHVTELVDSLGRGPLSEAECAYMKDVAEVDLGLAAITH